MVKPIIKFKTYKQSARVGGKIYGVPNLADPVVANVTMAEVIDYAKLHNYSADTLEALLSQVIAGVADLVARDGRPRNLSDLLKFEPVIKGTFDNMEQTVTDQKILVRPRLLKEIRVKLNASDYSWQNQNDVLSPRIMSVAPISDQYSDVNFQSFFNSIAFDVPGTAAFGWTFAGTRLCPNGWDANCKFEVLMLKNGTTYHFEKAPNQVNAGVFTHSQTDDASDNAIVISPYAHGAGLDVSKGWYYDGDAIREDAPAPTGGEEVIFRFTRTLPNGEVYSTEKKFVI